MFATDLVSTSWTIPLLLLASVLTVFAVKKTPLGHRALIYLPFIGAICGWIGSFSRNTNVPDPLGDMIGSGILGALIGGVFAGCATLIGLAMITVWDILAAIKARQLRQIFSIGMLVGYVPILAMVMGGLIGYSRGESSDANVAVWGPTLRGAIVGGQIGVGIMTLGLIGVTVKDLSQRRGK